MNEALETLEAQLAEIGGDTMAPLVQSALGSETVEVVDWQYERLHGGIAVRKRGAGRY